MSIKPITARMLSGRLETVARHLDIHEEHLVLFAQIADQRFPLTTGNFLIDDNGTLLIEDQTPNAAVAAIEYALSHDDPIAFLRCWLQCLREGNFGALRSEWRNVPEEVFIGADSHTPTTEALDVLSAHEHALLKDLAIPHFRPQSEGQQWLAAYRHQPLLFAKFGLSQVEQDSILLQVFNNFYRVLTALELTESLRQQVSQISNAQPRQNPRS
ncbi:conserved hypothetical protein [Pseudomonas sp. 8Z]|uniref:hypothetical protein n=1 Tax=Pseudomonas sp. 8Z TaxID=2653166 RepID=UPI0012F10854|nr:hypothetical protein [Pseudomonas sp. 8Z]VXC25279.1 conserved hypothetical protein [Pseudomonas sp. 8Z]